VSIERWKAKEKGKERRNFKEGENAQVCGGGNVCGVPGGVKKNTWPSLVALEPSFTSESQRL
jgi:hypothetical protein